MVIATSLIYIYPFTYILYKGKKFLYEIYFKQKMERRIKFRELINSKVFPWVGLAVAPSRGRKDKKSVPSMVRSDAHGPCGESSFQQPWDLGT